MIVHLRYRPAYGGWLKDSGVHVPDFVWWHGRRFFLAAYQVCIV